MTEADVDALTDELYVAPPTEFVAKRDTLAKQAREGGDRGLATAIKGLRRPSVGAWYLNTASRAGLGALGEVLRLGESLRAASASGDFDALRDLAKRRGPLVTAVVRELTALLKSQGTSATPAGLDEVRATLAAALADPEVADQVESGRLDRPHTYGGFGELMVVPAGAGPAKKPAKPAAKSKAGSGEGDAAARAAEEAERERIAQAERELASAEAELADAEAQRAEAEAAAREAEERIASLTRQLAEATHEQRVVEAEVKDAKKAEQLASRRVERARRDLGK